MRKSIKRILCGTLSLMMASSIVVENAYRSSANSNFVNGSTVTRNLSFENVTGQYDTSKLVESNLNTSVLDAEKTSAPKYETRTVVVTLEVQRSRTAQRVSLYPNIYSPVRVNALQTKSQRDRTLSCANCLKRASNTKS